MKTITSQPQIVPSAVIQQPTTIGVVDLIGLLYQRKGATFMSYEGVFPMDVSSRMRKKGNPHFGKGYLKHSKTTVLVTFDYDKALQTRSEGEEEAKGGPTWQQAVTRPDGSLTPLTVHKDDVTKYDANGNPCEYCDSPRVYLRAEWRKSDVTYTDANGNPLDAATVEEMKQFFPQREERTVEFMTVSFSSIKRLTFDGEAYILAHKQTETANV